MWLGGTTGHLQRVLPKISVKLTGLGLVCASTDPIWLQPGSRRRLMRAIRMTVADSIPA